MAFQNVKQLLARFKSLGATRVFCKRLAENDNSKQQIYLGSSFDSLSFFPHGEIIANQELKRPNFKATLDFYWVDVDSNEKAPGAQLILYPDYPEVRLSGFLRGCETAPSEYLQQIPRQNRNGTDGRVLVFGTTSDRRTLAYLAQKNSQMAQELLVQFENKWQTGLFIELTIPIDSSSTKSKVLNRLREIHEWGFHPSCRRNKDGVVIPYNALNGGGYTLEALLGITPNGKSEPDYLGWEIKAYSSNRITLMTPEPDGGFYGEKGAKEFVEKYGHSTSDEDMYFTGTHKVGEPCAATGMTLCVEGYDPKKPEYLNVGGSIILIDANGNEAASWAFAQLLDHWNRKHAFAAYIKYTSKRDPISYRYESPIFMGENTNFLMYLNALCNGAIVYDPGSKVVNANTIHSKVKARSQFRINSGHLGILYKKFTREIISR